MKRFLGLIALLTIGITLVPSCKNDDPSVAKVFVRNYNRQLIADAKVVIIGDVNSDPATPDYVDTLETNSSGFAAFDLAPLFDTYTKDQEELAFFDVLVKYDNKEQWEEMRARAHITSVLTVILPQ